MTASDKSDITPIGLPQPRAAPESTPIPSATPPPVPPGGEIPAWSRKYIGREIGFRFVIKRALAAGGMGSIFVGEQSNLNRQVAIKLVRTSEADMIQRMRQEAQSLAAVNHPGIVEVYDFIAMTGSKASDCYLVMGYVPGADLARYMDTVESGFLPPAEAVELLLPIASALVELHAREMIHRDIKLSNIIRFVGADGAVRTKLVDFGFARQKQDPNLTARGIVVGTPAYFAPEIVKGEGHSSASDVYALGVTLCKLLTGQNPHGEVDIGYLLQKAVQESVALPIWLMQTSMGPLVQSMLRREPEARPNMVEVLEGFEAGLRSLEDVVPGAGASAVLAAEDGTEPVNPSEAAGRSRGASGTRIAAWSLGALCLVLAAAVGFFALRWAPKKSATDSHGAGGDAAMAAQPGASLTPPVTGRTRARARARNRARLRPRPRPKTGDTTMDAALPTIGEIERDCQTQADMRRLFHPARKIILGKRRGSLEQARRTLEALLTASCTPKVVRHWVSYYLTKAYIKKGDCAGARRAFTLYEQYQLKHRRKKPDFPRCP